MNESETLATAIACHWISSVSDETAPMDEQMELIDSEDDSPVLPPPMLAKFMLYEDIVGNPSVGEGGDALDDSPDL